MTVDELRKIAVKISNCIETADEGMDVVDTEIQSWFPISEIYTSVVEYDGECYVNIETREGDDLYWGSLQQIIDYMIKNNKDCLEIKDLENIKEL